MSVDAWNQLEERCRDCQGCPLGKTRTNLVFGVGNREADLMFVGEAPGQAEDEQGIPFVGRAGQLLDDMLEIIGLDREQFAQVSMIAQGDFLKLLLASTDERIKIFRRIFNTERYQALQDALRADAGAAAKEYEQYETGIRQTAAMLSPVADSLETSVAWARARRRSSLPAKSESMLKRRTLTMFV